MQAVAAFGLETRTVRWDLVTLVLAGIPHRAPSDLTPLHQALLQLLDAPEPASARLAA